MNTKGYRQLDDLSEGSHLTFSRIAFPTPNVRLVNRGHHRFNVTRKGISKLRIQAWYHSLLDYTWARFFVVLVGGFLGINLLFGTLYFVDPAGIDTITSGKTFYDFFLCFCFSTQTITTIGYGKMAPGSIYIQILVLVESFASFILSAFITGIVFAKIARPTRITKEIVFSAVAVVNKETPAYVDGKSCLETGKYVAGKYNVLCIRIANARRPQLSTPQLRLLLLQRDKDSKFIVSELDYEIFNQLGRPRGINFSIPYLPLPWIIAHTIDEKSPLFHTDPHLWLEPENHFELIALLDGVDEAVSMNVQARWSYIPSEIVLDAKFTDITSVQNGQYEIDFTSFNDYESTCPLESN